MSLHSWHAYQKYINNISTLLKNVPLFEKKRTRFFKLPYKMPARHEILRIKLDSLFHRLSTESPSASPPNDKYLNQEKNSRKYEQTGKHCNVSITVN